MPRIAPKFHRYRALLVCLVFLALALSACSSPAAETLVPGGQGGAEPGSAAQGAEAEDTAAAPEAIGPMGLKILAPLDNAEVNSAEIEVKGQAAPGTVISLNDEIVVAGDDQLFSAKLALEPGLNVIEITASDAQGIQVTQYLTVTSDLPNP